MNIAIIFEGDIYKQRGEFIAIRNRIRELSKNPELKIDVYVLKSYVGKVADRILKFNSGERITNIQLDDVTYHCIWYKKSYINSLLVKIFKKGTNIEFKRIKKLLNLSDYDLVYTHSLNAGLVALDNKIKNGIPYVVLWHGSSIHTTPFIDRKCYEGTQKVLCKADMNLFVSKELQQTATNIANHKGCVSLNGVDDSIYIPYDDKTKSNLKIKYGISQNSINIGFIGNCYPVKNVGFLPKLFSEINKVYRNTHFFLVGSGSFNDLFKDTNLNYTCLDNVNNSDMPEIYNLMNLVVLPSKNEGLPMTCLEATACGVNFVASRVGAIAEVIGFDRTVPWTDSFNQNFVELCLSMLRDSKEPIKLSEKFKLSSVVQNELNIMYQIANARKK